MTFVEFSTRENTVQLLDISAEATGIFGFLFQDRVSTPKGPGTVLGVSKSGDLYFQLDADQGCSFWGSCKTRDDFERRGFCVIPQDNIRRHRVKKILFQGNPVHILLQDTNGPCPLLAAINALALSGQPVGQLWKGHDVVTQHMICDAILDLMNTNTDLMKDDGIREINQTKTLTGLVAAEGISLRKHFSKSKVELLYQGLDVSPFFSDVSHFEGEKDAAFFALLGLRMFHLWVVADASVPTSLCGKSYNQIQDVAVSDTPDSGAANDFLSNHSGQCTDLGVLQLQNALRDGEVAVLFRNNHFSTVVKLKGELLVLVTDEGYGDKGLIVFENLSLDGNFSYRDGEGTPIEPIVLSVLDTCGDQYTRSQILEAHAKLGDVSVAVLVAFLETSASSPPTDSQRQNSGGNSALVGETKEDFYTQLIEMGFDPQKCLQVCQRKPETIEVAVALILQ